MDAAEISNGALGKKLMVEIEFERYRIGYCRHSQESIKFNC